MADPVSITFAVVSIINITQQVVLLANKIHGYEGAKVDQIYYRLVAEKAKTKGWVNQLRDRNGEDFLSSIDPAEFEEVSLLIHRLEKYHEEAQVKYEGIKAAGGRGNQRSGTMKAKWKFLAGGFEDLKVMTDTLAAMNEALRSMVPVLPAYDGGPATSNQMAQPFQETQSSSNSMLRGEGIQPHPAAAAPSEEDVPPAAGGFEQVSPSIQAMWQLAVAGLTKIAMAKKDKALENSAGRLKLWGLGLFENGTTLDDVLLSRSSKDSPFYRILIRTLADVLLLEEREIKSFAADGVDPSQGRLLQVMSEITALLGTDELVVLAIEDWSNQLALSHESTEVRQIAETKNHAQHHAERTEVSIARTVENLFDLLPGIRAERRAYCYDKEIRRENDTRGKETVVPGLATLPSIEKQFEDVKLVISARDNIVRSEGGDDILEPTFAKVQARLEEFKENVQRTAKPATDEQWAEIFQPKLEEMSKTLANFLDEVNPEAFSPPSKSTDELKTSLKEIGARPRLDKMANEAVRDLIGTLDNELSTLWTANSQGPAV